MARPKQTTQTKPAEDRDTIQMLTNYYAVGKVKGKVFAIEKSAADGSIKILDEDFSGVNPALSQIEQTMIEQLILAEKDGQF